MFECIECQTKFFPKSPSNKYCSPTCSKSAGEKKLEEIYKITRFQIFERDGFCCVYCGQSPQENGVKLHVEHVYPRHSGGENDLFNLVTSCLKCNSEKGVRSLNSQQILQLWERSERLNKKKFDKETYRFLKEEFDKIWPIEYEKEET